MTWPHYAYIAADEMGYQEPDDEQAIMAFAAHWSGLDADALVRAAQHAVGEEWIFAVSMLSYSGIPLAREAVALHLNGSNPLERWISALYLGELGDERAFPSLGVMLTEFLPDPKGYLAARNAQAHFEDQRVRIASLLGVAGDSRYAPALREALCEVVQIEHAQMTQSGGISDIDKWVHRNALAALKRYEDAIVYSLGRLGAFAGLMGIPGIDSRLVLWRVHLVMGYLHGHYQVGNLVGFEDDPNLLDEVTALLEHYFALNAKEREIHLNRYGIEMWSTLTIRYAAEEARRNQVERSI